MSNESSSQPIVGGKQLKALQKRINEKNETFYVKKRGLFRKAEQVVKYCNSEVFIIVHNKDSDKIFSFTSDKTFNLEKISSLVLRDVQQAAFLHKNKKFSDEDFDKIMHNIKKIQSINRNFDPNAPMPHELQEMQNNELLLAARNGVEPETMTETMTEDMSMSHHQMSNAKRIQQQPQARTRNQENTHSYENHVSPRNLAASGKKKQQNVPVNPFGEDQMQNAVSPRQRAATHKDHQKSEIRQIKPVAQGQPRPQYESPQYQQYPGQPQYNEIQASPQPQYGPDMSPQNYYQQPNQGYYPNNFYQPPYQQQQQFYPKRPLNDSYGDNYMASDQDKKRSFVSQASVDINQYQKDKFNNMVNDAMIQQTANNDDIFLCYDRDDNRGKRNENSVGQGSAPGLATSNVSIPGPRVIKPPNQTPFTGVGMQKKFPSYVLGTTQKEPSQYLGATQESNKNQFFKPYNKVPSLVLGKLDVQAAAPQYLTNRIRSPTSHFDIADQYISSPRDGPKDSAPQGSFVSGIGVRARNKGMKNQSQISKISLVNKPPPERNSGVGLQSLNSSQVMEQMEQMDIDYDDDQTFKPMQANSMANSQQFNKYGYSNNSHRGSKYSNQNNSRGGSNSRNNSGNDLQEYARRINVSGNDFQQNSYTYR